MDTSFKKCQMVICDIGGHSMTTWTQFFPFLTRARPDWAYEFPDWTGPDTQICRTGLIADL